MSICIIKVKCHIKKSFLLENKKKSKKYVRLLAKKSSTSKSLQQMQDLPPKWPTKVPFVFLGVSIGPPGVTMSMVGPPRIVVSIEIGRISPGLAMVIWIHNESF